jgi:hypothetical protein
MHKIYFNNIHLHSTLPYFTLPRRGLLTVESSLPAITTAYPGLNTALWLILSRSLANESDYHSIQSLGERETLSWNIRYIFGQDSGVAAELHTCRKDTDLCIPYFDSAGVVPGLLPV